MRAIITAAFAPILALLWAFFILLVISEAGAESHEGLSKAGSGVPAAIAAEAAAEAEGKALVNCYGTQVGACLQGLRLCASVAYPDHEKAISCFDGFYGCVQDTDHCYEAPKAPPSSN